MKRTVQQQDFITALVETTDNLCLRARAGTGKTSTILEAVDDYAVKFPTHEIAIVAFGKAIQKEIELKLHKRGKTNWKLYQAATSHSLGFTPTRKAFNPTVDNNKVRDLIRAKNDPAYEEFFSQIGELVHLAKVEGFGFFDDVQIGDTHAWYELADHYNVNAFDDTTQIDTVVRCAQAIYRESLDKTDVVDFDDMILFPLIKNLKCWPKDLIFVDEAQDTSRARRALIKKFIRPRTGRIVVVGDDRQAIMGFAGASVDALGDLIAEFDCKVLPLNVTWRCPKAVVAEAQKLVPDIVAAETAIEGEVQRIPALPETLEPTDAILCRNTAPLVETAYGLIRRGIACKVEGREIGVGLLKIVNRWKRITTISAFLDKLAEFTEREVAKARAKGKDSKIQEIEDRSATLVVICNAVTEKGRHDLEGVRVFIADLFSDDVTGVVTLCTYHRSKGREWPRVFLFEHFKRCPSQWAKKTWELHQEANLAYVAITRAQGTLAYVD